VLVLDLDQQGNASNALGYRPDGKPTTSEVIYNICAGIKTDYESSVRHSEYGVDYVPSSQMLTNITSFISGNSDYNYVLKQAINNDVYLSYDYIMIDCRTLLDLLVSNALNASDGVIIPVECAVYSFDGLTKMINKVITINGSTNRDLQITGILLNKLTRTNVSTSIADSVRNGYGSLTFKTVVPYCPAQSEQAVVTQVCCVNDDNSSMGKAFMAIAEEVMQKSE